MTKAFFLDGHADSQSKSLWPRRLPRSAFIIYANGLEEKAFEKKRPRVHPNHNPSLTKQLCKHNICFHPPHSFGHRPVYIYKSKRFHLDTMTTMFTTTKTPTKRSNAYVTNTAAAISDDDHDDHGSKIVYHVRVVGAGLAGLTTTTTTNLTAMAMKTTSTTSSHQQRQLLQPSVIVDSATNKNRQTSDIVTTASTTTAVDIPKNNNDSSLLISKLPTECRTHGIFEWLSMEDLGDVSCVCTDFQRSIATSTHLPKERVIQVDCSKANYPQRLLQKLVDMKVNNDTFNYGQRFNKFQHVKLTNLTNLLDYCNDPCNGLSVSEWPVEFQLLSLKNVVQGVSIPQIKSLNMSIDYPNKVASDEEKMSTPSSASFTIPSMLYKSIVKLFPNLIELNLNGVTSIGPLENKFATLLPYLDSSCANLTCLKWNYHGYQHQKIIECTNPISQYQQVTHYFHSNFFKTTTMHLDGRFLKGCTKLTCLEMDHSIFWVQKQRYGYNDIDLEAQQEEENVPNEQQQEKEEPYLQLLHHLPNLEIVSLKGCKLVELTSGDIIHRYGMQPPFQEAVDNDEANCPYPKPLSQNLLMKFVKNHSKTLKQFKSDLTIENQNKLKNEYPNITFQ